MSVALKAKKENDLIEQIVDQLFVGHAAKMLTEFPAGCIDLVVTSPPYWNAVEYEGQKDAWESYDAYLDDMLSVWSECARVLRPERQAVHQRTNHADPEGLDRAAHPPS